MAKLPILYEDNHLLVINKPAMLPTMGVADDRATVLTEAKAYIKEKYQKPGNVYLGVVSRLDAPVTGALVIARTSKAASRLTAMFREREVQKIYWAVVVGQPQPAEGSCQSWLRKDERNRRMHACNAQAAGAKEARLSYRTLVAGKRQSLLEVTLQTGRKHQIRVQLAERDHPIIGDRKYGGPVKFPQGIALHSREVAFMHPVKKEPIRLIAPLPKSWENIALPSE